VTDLGYSVASFLVAACRGEPSTRSYNLASDLYVLTHRAAHAP